MAHTRKRSYQHMLEHCISCPLYEQLPESAHTPLHPSDHQRSKKTKSKSTQALEWFKNHIPQPNTWQTAQTERGLETVQSYKAAIESITTGSASGFDQAQRNNSVANRNDALSVARCLAKAAHVSRKEAALHHSISSFRSFVVLSICVCLESTHCWEDIDLVISDLGTQREEQRRKKLFRGVKAFNQTIIPAMINAGWPASRVTELLFLAAPSLTNIIEIQGQLQGLESHLRTLPYDQRTFAGCLDPKFTVPGTVIAVLSERKAQFSVLDVYKALPHGEPGLEKVVYEVLPAILPATRQFRNISFMATHPLHRVVERRNRTTRPKASDRPLAVNQRRPHNPLYRHLKTYELRQRDYDWDLFSAILEGDLLQVTRLLESDAASVWDTDPYGLNTTYYAGYYLSKVTTLERSLPICQLLKQHGAPMDLTDDVGNTIVDNLVECALVTRAKDCYGLSTREILGPVATFAGQALDDLLEDYLEGHCLTAWHRKLLQLDGVNLSATIRPIDAQDSKGRSTLAWATEFGMQSATKQLLSLGADPNQCRRSNGNVVPMLHSIIAASNPDDPDCPYLDIVSTLLKNGTNRDSRDHEGWTPWHVAASWNHYYMAERLLKTPGQQTIDLFAKTRDGKTALELATDPDFVSKVKSLVTP